MRSDINLDGQSIQTYNLANNFGVTYDCDLVFEVDFTEKLTGATANATFGLFRSDK